MTSAPASGAIPAPAPTAAVVECFGSCATCVSTAARGSIEIPRLAVTPCPAAAALWLVPPSRKIADGLALERAPNNWNGLPGHEKKTVAPYPSGKGSEEV